MPRLSCLFLMLFALLTFTHPAACQSTDFVAALSGEKHPLTLKLKDLDSSWRRMSSPVDATNQMQIYASLFSTGTQNYYYTKGETESLGGEIYLIAYHQLVAPIDYAAMMRNGSTPPPPPRLTPETALSLSLLNLRTIGSLNDIQPFSLMEALNPPSPPAPDPKEASVANLKQIGLALLQYTQDYDEVLPPMKTVTEENKALYPYVKDQKVFEDPATHELYQTNTSLSHRSIASFSSPATMVVYYEDGPADDGLRAVLFLDGHVKRIRESEWPQLKAASHVPILAVRVY